MKSANLRVFVQLVLPVFFLLAAPMLPAAAFTVNTTVDELNTPSGANLSLREAMRDANAAAGADSIVFDPSLNGATLTLTNILVNELTDTAGVTIDASALSAGITINCNGISRVFNNAGILTLRALTLTGGFQPNCCGGAAFYNYGSTMTVERCTITGNTAGYAAVFTENNSTTTLRQCTISSNTATAQAGAIYNRGTTILVHCTVSGNTSQGDAGGIYSSSPWRLSLENSIVSGNSSTNGLDILNFGTLTNIGANLVQAGVSGNGPIVGSGTMITNVAPLLAALGNYGGPTRTMLPQTNSPAIDAAVGSTDAIDQRGFLRPADGDNNGTVIADLGAVEVQSSNANLTNLVLSAGTLSPSFAAATTNYTVSVSSATSSVTVTATTAETNATITVNGNVVVSGTPGGIIPLNGGTNTLTIVVTAPNGTTTRTYIVSVYRSLFLVTSVADSGAGSLRQVLLDAAANPGADNVTFDPTLNGQVIALTSGVITLNDTDGVTIDASTLSAGITIDGNNADRIFWNNGIMVLRGLGLTRGFTASGNGGGAVVNFGTGTLERCTLSGNQAGYGAAIWNNNGATLTLRQCTVSGNTATTQSGAIENRGTNSLIHCTISGNNAPSFGGIRNGGGNFLTLQNCIVSGNAGANGADIRNEGTLTRVGASIVEATVNNLGTITGAGTITNVSPLLSALGNYGGPTKTRLPLNNSPALDAAVGSTETNDQRGFARPIDGDGIIGAVADIGAVELGGPDGALLANITLSVGTISPAFALLTTNYTAVVSEATSSITLTPTALLASATITVNGVPVTSGSASGNIALNVGANIITLIISASGGTPDRTYTVTVIRVALPSVTSPTSTAFTGVSAVLGGNVTSDGGGSITARGVVLSPTATNNNPQIGGASVVTVTNNGTTGVFTVNATGLMPLTAYTFKAYASNFSGAGYSPAGTFTTPDNNANLASLVLSAGTLSPSFASGTANYTVGVGFGVTNLTVTPTRSSPTALITVNSNAVASGTPSASIPLNVGPNMINVIVTAEDGTTKTYAINVTRRLPDLSNLLLNSGTLSPAYSNSTTNYIATVAGTTTNVTVTPTASQTNLSISINGTNVASGSASAAIALNPGYNLITIMVTAPDNTSNTYTIQINRPFTVTTAADEFDTPSGQNLSLREALRDALSSQGVDTIYFTPTLSGATISLTNGALLAADGVGVTVDATSLPNGVTLNGNGTSRVLVNQAFLTLRGVTLTGGFTGPANGGGAIYNNFDLTLERCTLTANVSGYGGAIYTEELRTTILRQCTIVANSATTMGGAIYNNGNTHLIHCTVAGNSAPSVGGIYSHRVLYQSVRTLSIENCIVSGNTDLDIRTMDVFVVTGANIVSNLELLGACSGCAGISFVDPLLGSLNNYGGPTKTVLLSSGSPAIDAAVGSMETKDQRGFARPVDGDSNGSALGDLGAVEYQKEDEAFLKT